MQKSQTTTFETTRLDSTKLMADPEICFQELIFESLLVYCGRGPVGNRLSKTTSMNHNNCMRHYHCCTSCWRTSWILHSAQCQTEQRAEQSVTSSTADQNRLGVVQISLTSICRMSSCTTKHSALYVHSQDGQRHHNNNNSFRNADKTSLHMR